MHWAVSQAATQAELAEAQTQRDKWQRQAESAAAQLNEARDEVAHHSEELVQLQVPHFVLAVTHALCACRAMRLADAFVCPVCVAS